MKKNWIGANGTKALEKAEELHLETRRDPSHETTNKTKLDEKSV